MLTSDPVLLLRNNLSIKLRINSTDFQAFTNVWILEEYKGAIEIKENDTVIDIGAHIGLFSIYISQFCKKGKIFCYEPIKENYDLLCHNINLNKKENVMHFLKAVTDKSETVKMFLNIDTAAHSLFVKSTNFIEVDSISLKEILDSNNIENCNLLKLDCEGSEYLILSSLPDVYFERIKKIIMEYHLIKGRPELTDELMKRLISLKYKISILKQSKDYGLLFAIKN